MSSHTRVQSREQKSDDIARSEGLGQRVGCAGPRPFSVLACGRKSDRQAPQLSDLRESGSIEQDADVVMFIYRPDIYGLKSPDGAGLEGIAEIIIGKQRNGPVGSVHLQWNAESATYERWRPNGVSNLKKRILWNARNRPYYGCFGRYWPRASARVCAPRSRPVRGRRARTG